MRIANTSAPHGVTGAGTINRSSGLRDMPFLGPIVVALLGPGGPVEDSEMAVDAAASVPPKDGFGAASAPHINLLYVRNGQLHAYGPALVIRGTVDNEAPIVDISVNGRPAQFSGRGFARRIAVPMGESDGIVRVEDADGNVVTSRFTIVRSSPGQGLAGKRITNDMLLSDYKLSDTSLTDRPPRIEDQTEPGIYMVLLAGTPAAHIIKMDSMARCRQAVAYTDNATCTFYSGR
jgi:hypothetical protein